jgi:hypothetical protein
MWQRERPRSILSGLSFPEHSTRRSQRSGACKPPPGDTVPVSPDLAG